MPASSRAAEHKRTVKEFFRLVGEGRMKEGMPFFAPECRQHNPYILGDMNALLEGMASAFKEGSTKYSDPGLQVEPVLADGDWVAAYTKLLSARTRPAEGGLRQVHLFRFEGDKIVEYWDITQPITPNMPNAAGAF